MKQYYLDTVAVRLLTRDLQKAAPLAFTSALTVLELISGLDEADSEHRSNTVKALIESDLEIDYRDPLQIITSCFSAFQYKNLWMDDLVQMAHVVPKSRNFQDFLSKIASLKTTFDDVKQFDRDLSADFLSSTNGQISRVRIEKLSSSEKITYLQREEKLVAAIVQHLAGRLSEKITIQRQLEAVETYNGCVGVFISAWKAYIEDKVNFVLEPGVNDWADLHHLTYLKANKEVTFVTDDQLLQKLLPRIGVKCITAGSFRKIISEQNQDVL